MSAVPPVDGDSAASVPALPAGRAAGPRMRRDQRRDQLLTIAQQLFASEGYHHVSMDDIADRALVSKPVLYRHFPSKLDLYLAVVDACGEDLLTTMDRALEPVQHGQATDGRDVVAAIVRAYISFVEVAGEASSLLFESDVTRDPGVRARVERASVSTGTRIAEALQQAAGLGPAEAATVSAALVTMAQGAAVHRLRHAGTLTAEATTDLVSRLAWGGVGGLITDVSRPAGSTAPTRAGTTDAATHGAEPAEAADPGPSPATT
ncbi:Nucleoid occlusion factor SlmA [Cellulomonas sp. T2.31MG-18]|uniref:TetR/AcrR family transcriptional regulator n=1 Tax=Cellulomonas sp. T2.31MG-18 TaxID=3157619 RepID=UPI0035EA0E71